MKAIQVKYLAPTNHIGARIKASAEGVKPFIMNYPYENSGERIYSEAALSLCAREKWPIELVCGQLPNGDYVFCFKNQ